MSKTLLIIGAGGHGHVVAETAIACGYIPSFLDDNNQEAVGTISQLEHLASQYDAVFVAIGNNEKRRELLDRVEKPITLIHPAAYISPSATIGAGSIVLPGAIVHTGVRIGKGCIISIGALVDHNAVVGDYCHINAGAICKSGSNVDNLKKIESGNVVHGY